MVSVWRNPLLACGLVLLVLGAGNWWVGRSKMQEYSDRVTDAVATESPSRLDEFPELNARTNAALLARLHRGLDSYTRSDAKLDFYRVVDSGGRMLAVAGLLLMCVALTHHRFAERFAQPRDAGH